MKTKFMLSVGLGAALALYALTGAAPATASHPPLLTQLRLLGHLTVVQATHHGSEQVAIRGWLGGVQAELDWTGVITLGTDMRRARYQRVDQVTRTVVLALPEPEVIQVGLDHHQSRVRALNRQGAWLAVVDAGEDVAMQMALKQAEAKLRAAVDEPLLGERAKGQAEAVLARVFGKLGWVVNVNWMSADTVPTPVAMGQRRTTPFALTSGPSARKGDRHGL